MNFKCDIPLEIQVKNNLNKVGYSLDFLHMISPHIFNQNDEYELKIEDGWFALYHKSINFKCTKKIVDFGDLTGECQKDIMQYICGRAEHEIYVEFIV